MDKLYYKGIAESDKLLTRAMLNDGNLENAFERTSSLTSLPRSPQNNR